MLTLSEKNVGQQTIRYRIFGTGKISLVIEMGLGASAGEWYHIAKHLSSGFTVLLYERGRNTRVLRTPRNIADELHELLTSLPCEEKLFFTAHSQGGLYIQQFARLYPERIKGIVFLDPLSARDSDYKKVFTTKEEIRKSGFDKTQSFRIMYRLSALHLGFVIKAIMKKAPPFYYYSGFSDEEKQYILNSLTDKKLHKAALEEYRLAHDEKEVAPLRNKEGFPQIPIVLITHGSEYAVREMQAFGGAAEEFARRTEDFWQKLMQEYLTLSAESKLLRSEKSGHYIHLTDLEILDKALDILIKGEKHDEKNKL